MIRERYWYLELRSLSTSLITEVSFSVRGLFWRSLSASLITEVSFSTRGLFWWLRFLSLGYYWWGLFYRVIIDEVFFSDRGLFLRIHSPCEAPIDPSLRWSTYLNSRKDIHHDYLHCIISFVLHYIPSHFTYCINMDICMKCDILVNFVLINI